MFVWPSENEVLLLPQTEHMSQSGDIGAVWPREALADGDEAFWSAVVLAARHHDEGWRGWELDPSIDESTGLPHDFRSVAPEEHAAFYSEGPKALEDVDPLASLLVSLHASGLYLGRYGLDGQAEKSAGELDEHRYRLVQREEERQRRLWERLGWPDERRADLWRAYRLLQVWDRFSGLLCHGRDTDVVGKVVTDRIDEDGGFRFERLDRWTAAITPYPFAEEECAVPVRGFLVDRQDFRDGADFRAELSRRQAQVFRFRLVAG